MISILFYIHYNRCFNQEFRAFTDTSLTMYLVKSANAKASLMMMRMRMMMMMMMMMTMTITMNSSSLQALLNPIQSPEGKFNSSTEPTQVLKKNVNNQEQSTTMKIMTWKIHLCLIPFNHCPTPRCASPGPVSSRRSPPLLARLRPLQLRKDLQRLGPTLRFAQTAEALRQRGQHRCLGRDEQMYKNQGKYGENGRNLQEHH